MLRVKILSDDWESAKEFKKGDIGYIDGYIRGHNNSPYAVVVIEKKLALVPFDNLEVLKWFENRDLEDIK